MKDPSGTNQELIEESSALKQRIQELEQSESERKRDAEALRESEEYFKAIIQNSSDIILIVDKLGTITYASPSVERFLGYGPDELIGKRGFDLIVSDDKPRAIAGFRMALQTKEVSIPNVFRIRHKDGTERILEGIGNNLLDNPIVAGFVMNIRDITEDKKTEEREKETTHRLKILFESNPTGLLLVNARTRVITSANPTALHIMDYSNEEVIGQICHKFVCPAELRSCPILDKGQSVDRSERMLIAKNNKQVPIIKTVVQVNINNELYLLESFIDITERKRAEEALRESEARYRAVSQSASDAIITVNGDGTIMGWNLSAGRMFGYPEAEILGQQLALIVPGQFRERHRDGLKRVQTGGERRVIGKTVELTGLRKDGSEFPLELSLSQWEIPDGHHYTGIIRDITERKKAEESLKETLVNLRKALNTTVQVMVSAVEARDPYTSGHQIRSADLARTIATEMGLPQEKIEGIRMAGTIHDIGKLSIPAEILSKPTKLTDIEFSLIKEHARKGYEMLKDVESPWPLAEIVNQHHERMDGSGYPRNLKGDDILVEARILAVADVVEAMASHRPYRPGLGIDAALNEIEKNRGIFYDDTVADACLRLFREKGFQLAKV